MTSSPWEKMIFCIFLHFESPKLLSKHRGVDRWAPGHHAYLLGHFFAIYTHFNGLFPFGEAFYAIYEYFFPFEGRFYPFEGPFHRLWGSFHLFGGPSIFSSFVEINSVEKKFMNCFFDNFFSTKTEKNRKKWAITYVPNHVSNRLKPVPSKNIENWPRNRNFRARGHEKIVGRRFWGFP